VVYNKLTPIFPLLLYQVTADIELVKSTGIKQNIEHFDSLLSNSKRSFAYRKVLLLVV